jgi:hypothetical protein
MKGCWRRGLQTVSDGIVTLFYCRVQRERVLWDGKLLQERRQLLQLGKYTV